MTSVSKVGNSMTYSYGGPSGYTPQSGAGIVDVVKSGVKFAQKHKVVSKIGGVMGALDIPGASAVKTAAKMTGTGKKRKSKK